jgi:hypothetical protein
VYRFVKICQPYIDWQKQPRPRTNDGILRMLPLLFVYFAVIKSAAHVILEEEILQG